MKFKRTESVHKAVRRFAQRRIQDARRSLEHCERLESVHEVRKDIKQLRALLRLVRPGLARSAYRHCTAEIRAAAACLSKARDAQVKLNALLELADHFKQELASDAFGQLKQSLSAACHKQLERLDRRQVPRRVRDILKKAEHRFASVQLRESGWPALSPGLKDTYRAGRRGFELAQRSGTVQNFHEWRKRVKDLYYQTEFLCAIWPEQLAAAEADLKRLSEFLGDDHDLSMLLESAPSKAAKKNAGPEIEVVKGLVTERQKQLRAQAFILGGRYYQEKPSVYCKRLGKHWKRWRDGRKRLRRGGVSRSLRSPTDSVR